MVVREVMIVPSLHLQATRGRVRGAPLFRLPPRVNSAARLHYCKDIVREDGRCHWRRWSGEAGDAVMLALGEGLLTRAARVRAQICEEIPRPLA